MCRDEERACWACRIFGAPWIPGKLRFTRLTLTGPQEFVRVLEERQAKTQQPPRTDLRYGVALSRRRGVAEDALLYATELFETGTSLEFSGTLEGSLDVDEVALVVAGLRMVPAIGRGKGGGLGWMAAEAVVKENGEVWGDDTLRAALLREATV